MSTILNFSIQTRNDIKRYILLKLGAPLITVELTEEQLDIIIDEATEMFSKFAIQDQKYLLVPLSGYVLGEGIRLPDNVYSVFSLSHDTAEAEFGSLYAIDASIMYSIINYQTPINAGFSFLTYETAKQYIDMLRIMVGKGFDFTYNERTKILTLYPEPRETDITMGNRLCVILGVYTVRPEEQLYGEEWVKRYALAEAKILLGHIRKKFNVQLIGGGTVDSSILEEGIAERDNLIKELKNREGPICGFVVG